MSDADYVTTCMCASATRCWLIKQRACLQQLQLHDQEQQGQQGTHLPAPNIMLCYTQPILTHAGSSAYHVVSLGVLLESETVQLSQSHACRVKCNCSTRQIASQLRAKGRQSSLFARRNLASGRVHICCQLLVSSKIHKFCVFEVVFCKCPFSLLNVGFLHRQTSFFKSCWDAVKEGALI